jgi:hypothetical protein
MFPHVEFSDAALAAGGSGAIQSAAPTSLDARIRVSAGTSVEHRRDRARPRAGLSSAAMAPKKQPDDAFARADLFRESEPLLPIARALKESIDDKLVGTGTGSGSPLDVDAAWDAAVRSVAEAIISERLGELDPERVLRLYAEAVDDETLKAKLGAWAAAKAEELERERRTDGLRADCARSGAIELARLEADTLIRLGLFEPRQISQAHRESSLPPSRTISLRLIDPERGYAEVIADTALGPSARGLFAPQARGRIGSTIAEGGEEWLEPRLAVHAPLGYDFGDGPTRTNEVIGFAEIGDGLLLLDGGRRAR